MKIIPKFDSNTLLILVHCSSLSVLQALRYVVLYILLAPYDNEQSDMIHRISEDKLLAEIPKYR